jgi:hypothetical protein
MNVAITADTLKIIQWLEPREDIDAALRRVLENEIRRRLAAYELTNRTFQRKYGLTLAEFETGNIVEQRGYSYEVENDCHNWDQAVDGIETLRAALRRLLEPQ